MLQWKWLDILYIWLSTSQHLTRAAYAIATIPARVLNKLLTQVTEHMRMCMNFKCIL